MKSTIVTALYDINRQTKGDGRTFDQYLKWLPQTLSLSSNYVIYTEEKVVPYIPKKPNIKIVVDSIPLQHLVPKIQSILDDPTYRSKIKDPNRVECILPEYNVIQYSKFEWLKKSINDNLFDSTHFFWMDAGCSRFFNGLSGTFPNPEKLPSKFLIQGNINTNRIIVDEEYKWKSDCVLVGTFFGGPEKHVRQVSDLTLNFLENEMLNQNMINNEQIALAYIHNRHAYLFDIYVRLVAGHLPILDFLS